MRNKELIAALRELDPEAVVELDVDIYPQLVEGNPREGRQGRRIVRAYVPKHDPKIICIEGCAQLRPHEEARLDSGIYEELHDEYESHWNGLYNDPIARRRILRDFAELEFSGINYEGFVERSWDGLPLRIQQIIIARVDIPERAHV